MSVRYESMMLNNYKPGGHREESLGVLYLYLDYFSAPAINILSGCHGDNTGHFTASGSAQYLSDYLGFHLFFLS